MANILIQSGSDLVKFNKFMDFITDHTTYNVLRVNNYTCQVSDFMDTEDAVEFGQYITAFIPGSTFSVFADDND